ncbi:hypothetical protein CRG98_050429 [Punica granatum]|uniref:Uncharacterized protein n=1 Tax=Punica granatum TaxID=22663 RepID=A0A2I0GCA0_PUNGR|nr:hypothetical protein CRG98_050429 [Punica granatum]
MVAIYEDTDLWQRSYFRLVETDTQVPWRSVIPPTSQDTDILKEHSKVMTISIRAFLVHMAATFGVYCVVLGVSRPYAHMSKWLEELMAKPKHLKNSHGIHRSNVDMVERKS